MNAKFKLFVVAILVIAMAAVFAGCGEKAEMVMAIEAEIAEVSEPGIFAYESSVKRERALKSAQRDGDVGSASFVLGSTNGVADLLNTTLWVDEVRQHHSVTTIVVAGHHGDTYNGVIECHKCGTKVDLEGKVESFHDETHTCKCAGNNHLYGLKKTVRVLVVPV